MKAPFSLATVVLCLLLGYHVGAQDILLVKPGDENLVINPHTDVLKDKTIGVGEIDKVVAAPDNAFKKNTYFQEVHYGFDQPSGWCRFTITNASNHKDWVIKVHQSRVDTVQLYVKRQTGQLIKYPLTGHFQPINERMFYSLNFAHPLTLEKDETIVCYLFTLRKFARHAAVLSLQKESYYRSYDIMFVSFISALVGICFLAVLIGIILFIFLRERVYIYYSIYCLSFVLFISTSTGFFYSIFNGAPHQTLINNFSMIFYYWIVGWHILFTIELLKLRKHENPVVYWVGICGGLLFCSAALILLLPVADTARRLISQGSYYIVFFLDAYILYALIIQWLKKEIVVFFYMAGFLATVVGASVLMLADLQLIEGINHRTDIFYVAPVFEIICMVIGLGINSSRFVKDRLRAQRQIITVQEDERKRIGQDLHDDVGNSLAAIKNMLAQRKDPTHVEREIDLIIRDVRNISHDLMPVDFKVHALPDVMRQTVHKFRDHPQINFEYNQSGTPVRLHPVAELMVYRIVNELMTNSIKHSEGSHVLIQLIYQDKSLMVMVEDNGKGIRHEGLVEKGIGLKNIQHRAAFINATLTIESDHKGSLFIIEVPYEKHVRIASREQR